MKFSFGYVKKNPVMFGTIFVVFGLLIWLLLNRSASASQDGGTTSYVTSGPTDAEIAGQVALGQASIAANSANQQAALQLAAIKATADAQVAGLQIQGANDLALGTLSSKVALEEIAASRELGNKQIDAQTSAILGQYATTFAMQADSNATQLAIYSKMSESTTRQAEINANLQATLGQQTADAFKVASTLNVIPTLKKKDRDNALVSLMTGAGYRGGVGGVPLLGAPTTVQAA